MSVPNLKHLYSFQSGHRWAMGHTSLLCWWQSTTGFHNSKWRRWCLSQIGALCVCCSRLVYPSPPTAEPNKTEAIWFGSNANIDRLAVTDVTICFDQATIHPSDCVRKPGVLLDSSLSMRQHIAKIASTCFFHLRRLRKLRRVLDLAIRFCICPADGK